MLIPAGIPDPAKDKTSKLVKSGLRNLSFSNSVDQGSFGIIASAASTSDPKALVRSRFTMDANPASRLVFEERANYHKICPYLPILHGHHEDPSET